MTTKKPHSLPRNLRNLAFLWGAFLISAWFGLADTAMAAEKKGDPMANAQEIAPGAKITKGEATQSALKALPGKVTDVSVERKRGKEVYVIEIISEKDGKETDVLVDMQTGIVLGME